MTEEDQKLVALAALHGARFSRSPNNYWVCEHVMVGMATIGRAAAKYLKEEGLLSDREYEEYRARTQDQSHRPKEVDKSFIAQFTTN